MATYVIAAYLSVIAAILPTIGYVLLVWRIDRYEKEPIQLLVATFIWGAVPAALLSFVAEAFLRIPLGILGPENDLLAGSIVAPLVEETTKALALWALYSFARSEFDDVLDGIVYGALIGLGFGMTEDVLYFLRGFQDEGFLSLVILVPIRALLFGLTHALYTAIAGAGLGYARLAHEAWKRRAFPLIGLAGAVFFHAVHNALVSEGETCFGVLGAAVSDWSGLLLLALLIALAWRKEKSWVVDELKEEVALGILSPEDYDVLSSHGKRVRTYLHRWRERGWREARLWGAFVQQATELAFRKHHGRRSGSRTDQEAVQKTRRRIAALRWELGEKVGPTVCPSCGQLARPGNSFCIRCGQSLERPYGQKPS